MNTEKQQIKNILQQNNLCTNQKNQFIKICLINYNILQQIIQNSNKKSHNRLLITSSEQDSLIDEIITDVDNSIHSNKQTSYILCTIIIVVSLLLSMFLINKQGNFILNPINNLQGMLQSIQEESVETNLLKGYIPVYREIDLLTAEFQQLNIYLKFSNDNFFKGNSSDSLIKYANALILYQKTNSIKGQGIAYNNMGNIHMENNRILEAIENYKLALNLVENEFLNLVKHSHLHVFYKVKPVNGWDSLIKNDQNQDKDQKRQVIQVSKDRVQLVVNYKNKQKLEYIISNRLYNLSLAYKRFLQQDISYQKSIEILDIIIDNLSLVTKIDQNLKRKTSRQIKAFIYLSEALAIKAEYIWKHQERKNKILKQMKENREINQVDEKKLKQELEDLNQLAQKNIMSALVKMNVAEDKLQEYEQVYQLFVEEENIDDPPSIIQQKIIFQKGLILKSYNNPYKACQYFTQCIEFGKYYSPDIRRRCLQQLQEIFTQYNIIQEAKNIPKMIKELERKKNKDIVFLLDYSESMKYGNRQQNALKCLLNIYDNYIDKGDRLAYLRFSHQVDILFELQDMNMNVSQRRLTLSNTIKYDPSGETAFFYALNESINLFQKAENKKNQKWILCLTDGDDSCSKITKKQISKRLKQEKIGLIVVGIGLNQSYAHDLNKLCTKTGGFFIESLESDDINIALQSISNLNHGVQGASDGLIVEQFR